MRQLPWLAHHKDLPPRRDASPVPPISHSMLPNSGRIPCRSNPHPMIRMDVRHFGAADRTQPATSPCNDTTWRGARAVGRRPSASAGSTRPDRGPPRNPVVVSYLSSLPKASSSSSSFMLCVIRALSRGPSCGHTVREIISTEEPVR